MNYSIKILAIKGLINPNEYKFFYTPEDGIILNFIDIEKYNNSLSLINTPDFDTEYYKDETEEKFEFNNEKEYLIVKDILINKMKDLGFHHDLVTQKYYDDILATEDDVEYCCVTYW